MAESAEFLAALKKEREFLATPLGAAFNRVKNTIFAVGADEYKETVSDVTLSKHDDAAKQAEREFRTLLDELIAKAALVDKAEATRQRNLAKAEELLREAGYVPNGDGTWSDPAAKSPPAA